MEKIHPSRTAEGIREIADERALSVSRLYGEYTRTRMMSPGTARWLAAKNAAGPDQTGLEDCLFGLTSRADPSITRDALRELASATIGDDIQGRGRSTEPQGPFADIVDALVSGDLDTIQTAYRTVNQVLALTERLCSYSNTELHDRVEAQVLRCRECFHTTDTLDEKKQLIQETLNEMRQTRDSSRGTLKVIAGTAVQALQVAGERLGAGWAESMQESRKLQENEHVQAAWSHAREGFALAAIAAIPETWAEPELEKAPGTTA